MPDLSSQLNITSLNIGIKHILSTHVPSLAPIKHKKDVAMAMFSLSDTY